jgi:L-lysine exporter family protein LysE/ArgO
MNAFWISWSTTVGLLAAIGAQNIFVIESAIQRRHAFPIALTYIVSDFIMISCGYLGLSVAVKSNPEVQVWFAWIGIIFLSFYGALKLKASLESQSLKNPLAQPPISAKKSILKALGFSWFNPHVYVDTLILIPALALQYSGRERFYAGIAGYVGVITWFLSIATLGTWSSKLFQNPQSWRILNLTTAFIMFWVALKLYKELI